jgi:hypothetical protein
MELEKKAMIEWCVYRSQEFAMSACDDDRLYLSDISGGHSILMTSRKSIEDCTSEAYKTVFKTWTKLPESEKKQFRSLVQKEECWANEDSSGWGSSDESSDE